MSAPQSPIVRRIYASSPGDDPLIGTLAIAVPGEPIHYVCDGFTDVTATLETDEVVTFTAGPLAVAKAGVNTSGKQTLRFGVPGMNGEVRRLLDLAREATEPTIVTFREYRAGDLSAPTTAPFVMEYESAELTSRDGRAIFSVSYFDVLNKSWPTFRYALDWAPGLASFE